MIGRFSSLDRCPGAFGRGCDARIDSRSRLCGMCQRNEQKLRRAPKAEQARQKDAPSAAIGSSLPERGAPAAGEQAATAGRSRAASSSANNLTTKHNRKDTRS